MESTMERSSRHPAHRDGDQIVMPDFDYGKRLGEFCGVLARQALRAGAVVSGEARERSYDGGNRGIELRSGKDAVALDAGARALLLPTPARCQDFATTRSASS
jgi:hypothetical protein